MLKPTMIGHRTQEPSGFALNRARGPRQEDTWPANTSVHLGGRAVNDRRGIVV